jgi:hypothetical protein
MNSKYARKELTDMMLESWGEGYDQGVISIVKMLESVQKSHPSTKLNIDEIISIVKSVPRSKHLIV